MQFIRAAIFMYWGSVQLLRFLFICSSVLPWQFDFVCKSVYAYCHEDSFSCLKISFFPGGCTFPNAISPHQTAVFICSDPRGADAPSNDCDLKALSRCSSYLAGTLIHNISDAVDALHTSFLLFLEAFQEVRNHCKFVTWWEFLQRCKEVVKYADR